MLVLLLLVNLAPLQVLAQESFSSSYPSVKAGNYFLWQTNSTQPSFSIKGIIETRNEKIEILSVKDFGNYTVVKYNWTFWVYWNGSLHSESEITITARITQDDLRDPYFTISARLFNIHYIESSLSNYLTELSSFTTNATIEIYESWYLYNGTGVQENRSVVVGVLNATDCYAKYVVDKEYGVLLARELWRIRRISGQSQEAKKRAIEITILKDTNIFRTKLPLVILIIIIIAVVILPYVLLRRRK